MDLKAVLLQSTSTEQTLSFRTRCHIGKKCYTIAYEVHRKFLTLTLIRRVRSKLSDVKSARCKRKGAHVLLRRHQTYTQTEYVSRATQTDREAAKRPCADNGTQTQCAAKTNKRLQTDSPHATCDRQQQTKRISQCGQSVQTERSLIAMWTQTEHAMISRCQSTEPIQSATCACQTEVSTNNVVTQTDASHDAQLERLSDEREAVVLLLNEIGEMIISQNHLLHTNSTLLGQLTEQSLLQGKLHRIQLTAKQKVQTNKTRSHAVPKVKYRRWKFSTRMCPSNESLGFYRSPEVSDKGVQVDIAKSCSSTASQTDRGGDEPKRRNSSWKIFKHN